MGGQDNRALNRLIMRVLRRAENAGVEHLARTFVPVDPLSAMLDSPEHHILYGRRGTGKTHLLKYLAEARRAEGDVSIYLDLRQVGSSGGLYSDSREPVTVRATHLLVDVIEAVHTTLYESILSTSMYDEILDDLVPSLDAIADAASRVKVVGQTEKQTIVAETESDDSNTALDVAIAPKPEIKAALKAGRKRERRLEEQSRVSGSEVPHVLFGTLGRAFTSLLAAFKGRRLWLLLDEWSSIPIDLQPLLADLIRRSFFPVSGVSVKIGTIERLSAFRVDGAGGDYVGIDLGADTAASLDLDDFLIFKSDRAHALAFFGELLYRHVSVLMSDLGYEFSISSAPAFVQTAFASHAFSELVKAAQGVPRDALNIAGLAAAAANTRPITIANVHAAARDFYVRDKHGKISQKADGLLSHIVHECTERGGRELLLRRYGESDSPLIQTLYDNRLLNRVRQIITL